MKKRELYIRFYLEHARNSTDWQVIEPEYEQIRRAWDMLNEVDSETNNDLLAIEYVDNLMTFQFRRGLWVDEIRWHQRALVAAKSLCYRTENPFAMCGTVGGSMGNRKLTGTRNPSRSAYCIARSPI